jgi:hypothetical protein
MRSILPLDGSNSLNIKQFFRRTNQFTQHITAVLDTPLGQLTRLCAMTEKESMPKF